MFLTTGQRVFVVLLNYRKPADTIRCVASLRRSTSRDLHPVIVDNASGASDVAALRDALGPAQPILVAPDNLGYAAGNNLGIRHALERDADLVWILNPDTEVEPGTLQNLLTTMHLRPDAGFVGSLNLFGGTDPAMIQFAGGTIDWEAGAVTESLGRGKPLARRPAREPYEVDYVAGTSMLVRRSVFEEVGLLPERYFLYFEETDYQVTATRRGWKSVLNPMARVWHYQTSAAHLPEPFYIYYYVRGRLLFAKKFTKLDDEAIVKGLDGFIGGWRSRVTERAPEDLEMFETLVKWGLADGLAGVTGRRAEIDDLRSESA